MKKPTQMKARIAVEDHWYGELAKIRAWLSGFAEGRRGPGQSLVGPPGEDVLRQIQIAIKDAKP